MRPPSKDFDEIARELRSSLWGERLARLEGPAAVTKLGFRALEIARSGSAQDLLRLREQAVYEAEWRQALSSWNERGETCVGLAAERGDLALLEVSLEGWELDRPNAYGVEPLSIAARLGHLDCVQALLKAGAKGKNEKHGRGALHWACIGGSLACVRHLLARPWFASDLRRKDAWGCDPLALACMGGHAAVVETLAWELGASKPAKPASGEVSGIDLSHAWAALCAPEERRRSCVRQLSRSYTLLDGEGMDLLMRAAAEGESGLLDALAPHLDPQRADNFGQTALMWALIEDAEDGVRFLLPLSDLSARTANGETAAQIAARRGASRCLALIEAAELAASGGSHASSRARRSAL